MEKIKILVLFKKLFRFSVKDETFCHEKLQDTIFGSCR